MTAPDHAGVLPADTRGIVDPAAMVQVVDFARYPPGDALDGLVDWFWSVSWDLPPGQTFVQQVLNHPAGHISIGTIDDAGVPLHPPQGRVYGVITGVSERRLTVDGWTVAAKTTVGGLGVFLDRPARSIADTQMTLTDALPGVDADALLRDVSAGLDNPWRVERLRTSLERLVASRDPALVTEARATSPTSPRGPNRTEPCVASSISPPPPG